MRADQAIIKTQKEFGLDSNSLQMRLIKNCYIAFEADLGELTLDESVKSKLSRWQGNFSAISWSKESLFLKLLLFSLDI